MKLSPVSDILVRMKFVVPLTIPRTRFTRSPASDSFKGRMMGIPPADRRLEEEINAGGLGGAQDLLAQRRQQLLVSRHNVLLVMCRLHKEASCGLDTTHDLDDDVYARIGHERMSVGRERSGGKGHGTRFGDVADRDARHLDWRSGTPGKLFGMFEQEAGRSRSHDPASEQADTDGRCHRAIVPPRSISLLLGPPGVSVPQLVAHWYRNGARALEVHAVCGRMSVIIRTTREAGSSTSSPWSTRSQRPPTFTEAF